MIIEQKLAEMGIELPAPAAPAGLYVPTKRVGNLLYVSGHTPDVDGVAAITGTVGLDLTVEQGAAAARLAAINMLSSIKAAVGDLDNVAGFVQVLGYIRSTSEFDMHPKVLNGASQLFADLWGSAGIAARMAIGTNSLPENAACEIIAVVELKS